MSDDMNWSGAGTGAASGAAMGSAILPGWGTAAGALVGGLVGLLSSAQARGASDAELQAIVDGYKNLSLPQQQQITAQQISGTAMDGANADPATQQAQYSALNRLLQQGQGGLTLGDKADLNLSLNEAGRQGAAQRQAIQNQMDARGTGNSGASVAMQLAAANNEEGQAQDAGLKATSTASRNALQALSQAGTLGGQMNAQQFSQAADKAKARDMMAEYNTNARSQADYYNAKLPQQAYEDQLQRLQGMSGGLQGQATQNTANANRTQGMYTGLGTAVGQIGGTLLRPGQQQAGTLTPEQQAPIINPAAPTVTWDSPSSTGANYFTPQPLQAQDDTSLFNFLKQPKPYANQY